jgi:hypothetical protein
MCNKAAVKRGILILPLKRTPVHFNTLSTVNTAASDDGIAFLELHFCIRIINGHVIKGYKGIIILPAIKTLQGNYKGM